MTDTYARTYQLTSKAGQYDDFDEFKVAGQHGQHHNLLDEKLKADKAFKDYYESQKPLLHNCRYETGHTCKSRRCILHDF